MAITKQKETSLHHAFSENTKHFNFQTRYYLELRGAMHAKILLLCTNSTLVLTHEQCFRKVDTTTTVSVQLTMQVGNSFECQCFLMTS